MLISTIDPKRLTKTTELSSTRTRLSGLNPQLNRANWAIPSIKLRFTIYIGLSKAMTKSSRLLISTVSPSGRCTITFSRNGGALVKKIVPKISTKSLAAFLLNPKRNSKSTAKSFTVSSSQILLLKILSWSRLRFRASLISFSSAATTSWYKTSPFSAETDSTITCFSTLPTRI